MEVEATLATVPLLAGLDKRTLSQLAQRVKVRSYAAGEAIIHQDAPAAALYIILTGHADVELEHGEAPGLLGHLGPGDFFGELALIEEHARTATVRATEPVDCALFVAWEFTALLKEYPQVAVPIMYELIKRIHRREHRAQQ